MIFRKIGDILGGVVKAGANTVSQLQFTINDPDVPKSVARAEAIAKAKTKAEEIAKAGGFGWDGFGNQRKRCPASLLFLWHGGFRYGYEKRAGGGSDD